MHPEGAAKMPKNLGPVMFLTLAVLSGCASAQSPGSTAPSRGMGNENAVPAPDRTPPKIVAKAAPGFRIYRSGYRLTKSGALVTAQLCRLPGWAAAGPGQVQVERVDPGGRILERHSSYLARLGLKSGNNCTSITTLLDSAPNYGEQVNICALSGRSTCR